MEELATKYKIRNLSLKRGWELRVKPLNAFEDFSFFNHELFLHYLLL